MRYARDTPHTRRLIFHPDDDALLDYLEDDGQSIEPTQCAPRIIAEIFAEICPRCIADGTCANPSTSH